MGFSCVVSRMDSHVVSRLVSRRVRVCARLWAAWLNFISCLCRLRASVPLGLLAVWRLSVAFALAAFVVRLQLFGVSRCRLWIAFRIGCDVSGLFRAAAACAGVWFRRVLFG